MKALNHIKNALISVSDVVGVVALAAGIIIGAGHFIFLGASLIALGKLAYDESKLSNNQKHEN